MGTVLAFSFELLLWLAPLARPSLAFDIGPAAAAALTGFTESWEYWPVTARFAGEGASLSAPLVTDGGQATLVIRAAQVLDTPLSVRLLASGVEIGRFEATPVRRTIVQWQEGGRPGSPFQEMRTLRFPVEWPSGAFRLDLQIDDPDHSALAVDRIQVDGLRWRVPFSTWAPRALVIGAFVIVLAAGLAPGIGIAASGGVACLLAAWAALDPFGLVYASSKFAGPALALSILLAWIVRRHGGATRWLVLPFLAGYLVKGATLFHPSIYYPDVLTHSRFAARFQEAEGSLVERGRTAQELAHIGYPRPVAGRLYAMPYSPLYYVPFTLLLPDRGAVEDAMRQVSLAAAAAEVPAVFALGALIFAPKVGLWAAVLAAFLPPLQSRLLYAMWPTVAGHLLDVVALIAVLAYGLRPSGRRLLAVGGFWLVALLTYISSLFTLTAFAAALAVLAPRRYARLLVVAIAATVLTIGALYSAFVHDVFTEIIPAWLHPAATVAPAPAAGSPEAASLTGRIAAGLLDSFVRVPMFYGIGYPLLAVAGLLSARRLATPEATRVLAAYGIAVVFLFVLKGASLGLFKDVKEVEFAGPFFTITAGAALSALASRERAGRIGALGLAGALLIFGVTRAVEYVMSAVWLSR